VASAVSAGDRSNVWNVQAAADPAAEVMRLSAMVTKHLEKATAFGCDLAITPATPEAKKVNMPSAMSVSNCGMNV